MMTSTQIDNNNDDVAMEAPLIGAIEDVTMHPLVLLNAADHYHRVARGTRKRVVGVLLGSVSKGKVDCTNSFAVPFEEDSKNAVSLRFGEGGGSQRVCGRTEKRINVIVMFIRANLIISEHSFFDPELIYITLFDMTCYQRQSVFYLDHNFLESMLAMFRKISAKERVVGFYSSGPQIRQNDLRIYEIVKRYLPQKTITPPVFCIIDIRPDRQSSPTTAYKVVEEVSTKDGQLQVKLNFAHVPSQMGAMEAEEVGVEHLLRDINDPTVSSVASLIQGKISGLTTLAEKLIECKDYLESCVKGDQKVNPEIVANLQTILNLLPNLNTEEMVRSILIKTNDMQLAIYLSALIRSVIALHDLINNRIRYGENGTDSQLEDGEEKKEESTQDSSGAGQGPKDTTKSA
jgi:26S proteasome regulatory subunit N8